MLADVNLVITKAYISSDGVWFMDGKVFYSTSHVKAQALHFSVFCFSSSSLPSLFLNFLFFSV